MGLIFFICGLNVDKFLDENLYSKNWVWECCIKVGSKSLIIRSIMLFILLNVNFVIKM